jgi:hypothetical protein
MGTKKETIIQLAKPDIANVEFHIVGTTPLLIHRLGKKYWDELMGGRGKPKKKVERDMDAEFRDSLYYLDGDCNTEIDPPAKIVKSLRYGFPASAFKKAMVGAARQFNNISMTEVRGHFFVLNHFVEIKGTPVKDEFWRRIGSKGPGTGTPDIGVRARFDKWDATLQIQYLANVITPESIANLLSVAGFSGGIGEDRPSKSGNTNGQWQIA